MRLEGRAKREPVSTGLWPRALRSTSKSGALSGLGALCFNHLSLTR